MRKLTGLDIALIVFGGIQLVLTFSLYGVCGSILNGNSALFDVITLSNLGTASWYLLVCILAIAAGATGHSCPYISTIVLSILAILAALGAAIVSTLGLFGIFNFVYAGVSQAYSSSYRSSYGSSYGSVFGSSFGRSSSGLFGFGSVLPSYELRVGMAVINWLSFLMLIPLSCIACCATCNKTPNNTVPTTTYVTTGPQIQGGAPPGYMMSPPGQPYGMQMQQQMPAAAPSYPGPAQHHFGSAENLDQSAGNQKF